MRSFEHIADLLVRLEQLAESEPTLAIEDLAQRDPVIAEVLEREPELLPQLRNGLRWLRGANQQLGLSSSDEPIPSIPGFTDLMEIGYGGMGIVYRAYQTSLRRTVAIKLMLAGRFGGKALRERFRIEAEAVARLRHPNIVEIYEIGEVEGVPYTCFEYLAGRSLAEAIAEHLLSSRDAAETVRTLADAISHAHAEGIVHRDLKPSNVRATDGGVYKITDFGIAKDLHQEIELTRTGETPGSPSYMAPEQIAGDDVGPPADVYALGAILYELLTGRPPFLGETSVETIQQASFQDPVPPSRLRQGVARDLESICLKCLEKTPERRYASADAMARDLGRFLAGRPTVARPPNSAQRLSRVVRRRPVFASVVTVSCIALLAFAALGWLHSVRIQRALQRERDARRIALASQATAVGRAREAVAERRKSEQLRYWEKVKHAHDAWKSDVAHTFDLLHPDVLTPADATFAETFPIRYLKRLANLGDTITLPGTPQLYAAAFLDEELILVGEQSGALSLWDVEAKRLVKRFIGHSSCVNSFNVSPDGELVASASCDATIGIWGASDLTLRMRLESPDGRVGTVRFTADGQRLIAIGVDHTVALWRLADGERLAEIVSHNGELSRAVANRDATWIATATSHGRLCWWPVDDPSARRQVETHSSIESLRFDRAGTRMIATGRNLRTWIWHVNDESLDEPFRSFGVGRFVALSHDDRTAAIVCSDEVIRLVDLDSKRQEATIRCPGETNSRSPVFS